MSICLSSSCSCSWRSSAYLASWLKWRSSTSILVKKMSAYLASELNWKSFTLNLELRSFDLRHFFIHFKNIYPEPQVYIVNKIFIFHRQKDYKHFLFRAGGWGLGRGMGTARGMGKILVPFQPTTENG